MLLTAYLWSDEEIPAAGDALVDCLGRAGLTPLLVGGHMRRSGRFERYRTLDDADLLRQAWGDAAQGMNHIIRVYGLGEPPLYPLIDAIGYAAPGEA